MDIYHCHFHDNWAGWDVQKHYYYKTLRFGCIWMHMKQVFKVMKVRKERKTKLKKQKQKQKLYKQHPAWKI